MVSAVSNPLSSLTPWLVAASAVVALIVAFALVEWVIARRARKRWGGLGDDQTSRRAAEAVVAARSRLAAAIEADRRVEVPIRRHPALGNVVPQEGRRVDPERDALDRTSGPIERERDAARESLLDAQRLWEAVRPRRDTVARVGLWSGRGQLRAWQLGPVGFERVVLRSDHLLDPDCWNLSEYRRWRLGLGLGFESLEIAVFAAAVPSRRLDDLLRELCGGSELALRPGTAPLRWWRTSRRSQIAQTATQAVLADRDLGRAPLPSTTDAVWAAVREDLGNDVAIGGSLPVPGPIAVSHTSGPSLLVGAWWGAPVSARLISASSHVVWRDPT